MFAALIAVLLSASASPSASSPYPGFEALTETADGAIVCTKDDICIDNNEDQGVLIITRGDQEIARWSPEDVDGDRSFKPLPALVRLAGGRLLVGTLATRTSSYSGGGGNASEETLALVEPGKPIKTVLTVPFGGFLSIRACFSEQQYRHRAGACSAEFRFSATLSAGEKVGTDLPPLRLRMAASHFPRGASRNEDGSGARLQKRDLIWENDPRCTFERGFHFDISRGVYQPDAALPDCTDYSEP